MAFISICTGVLVPESRARPDAFACAFILNHQHWFNTHTHTLVPLTCWFWLQRRDLKITLLGASVQLCLYAAQREQLHPAALLHSVGSTYTKPRARPMRSGARCCPVGPSRSQWQRGGLRGRGRQGPPRHSKRNLRFVAPHIPYEPVHHGSWSWSRTRPTSWLPRRKLRR